MEERILTKKTISDFKYYLQTEEKSANTVGKYVRDVNAFFEFVGEKEVSKEVVISYKNELLSRNFTVRSVNSMLASINSLFSFLGWHELRVKLIKLQRQIFCPEEKELTKAEYMRLVNAARKKRK